MHPVRSILWELWRGQRVTAGLTAAAVLTSAGAAQVASSATAQDWLRPLAHVLMAVSLLASFAGFTFTETNRQLKLAVFPLRLFAFPISTRSLVLTPMVAGALSVALVYAAWVGLVFGPLGDDQPLIEPALLLMTGMFGYQAVMWGLAEYRLLRLIICGLLGGLLLWLLVLPESVLPGVLIAGGEGLRVAKLSALLVVINGVVIAFAWRSVARQRHQPTAGTCSRVAGAQTHSTGSVERRPFRSPQRAQFWLEWRRNGWIFPGLTAFVAVILAFPVPWMIELGESGAFTFAVGCALAPIAIAILVGKGFAVPDFWTRELSLPPFVAVRPLSCGEWVFVRLRLAGVCAGLGGSVVLVALISALTFTGSWPGLWTALLPAEKTSSQLSPWLVLGGYAAIVAVLVWRSLVISLYNGLVGRQVLFLAATSGTFLSQFILLPWLLHRYWPEFTPYNTSFNWRAVVWGLCALWLIKLVTAWWAWSEARRRHLVTARELAGYTCCWGVTVAGMVMFVLVALPVDRWVREVAALAVGLLVPLTRIGLAPSAFSLNRHRRISTSAPPGVTPLAASSNRLRLSVPFRFAPAFGLIMLLVGVVVVVGTRQVVRATPQLVSVNGQEFRVLVCGRGSPAVVLEGDMQATLKTWAPIQQALARETTVVAYERPGFGGSAPVSGARSLAQNAADLGALLRAQGVTGEVVVVGANIGAAYARSYAAAFPEQVRGLVLLDPSDDETSTEILERLRREHPELSESITAFLNGVNALYRPYAVRELQTIEQALSGRTDSALAKDRAERWESLRAEKVYMKSYQFTRSPRGAQAEFQRLDALLLEDRTARLPALQLTVLTGVKLGLPSTLEREGMQAARLVAKLTRRNEWLAVQTNAVHVLIREAGEDVMGDVPELVVRHTLEVLENVRRR